MSVSDLGQISEVAKSLAGEPVEAVEQVGGGRNSRVFRVDCKRRRFALKQYPSRNDDPRDRLATEVGALRLMEAFKLAMVPRVVATDASRGFALLSWIDGVPVGLWISQQPSLQGWVFGISRFRVLRLGRSGEVDC